MKFATVTPITVCRMPGRDSSHPQVDLEPPQVMVATDAELLVAVLERHLVRMLQVAPHLQMLDFTCFAIQARAPKPLTLNLPSPGARAATRRMLLT